MAGQALLALLLGAGVGLGFWLLLRTFSTPATTAVAPSGKALVRLRPGMRRAPLALLTAAIVLLVTGWPVVALAAAFLVMATPALMGGAAEERRAAQRLEELVRWAESLRDTLDAAAGVEQAIAASTTTAGPHLRPHVQRLVERLHARVPLRRALVDFAADLDDPAADELIAPLILNAELRGAGLRDVLGRLAVTGRAQVHMRHRVLAQRASTRSGTRVIVVFVTLVVLVVTQFRRDFVEPYSSLTGQLVLAITAALATTSFLIMRRVATIDTPGRFLATTDEPRAGDRT